MASMMMHHCEVKAFEGSSARCASRDDSRSTSLLVERIGTLSKRCSIPRGRRCASPKSIKLDKDKHRRGKRGKLGKAQTGKRKCTTKSLKAGYSQSSRSKSRPTDLGPNYLVHPGRTEFKLQKHIWQAHILAQTLNGLDVPVCRASIGLDNI